MKQEHGTDPVGTLPDRFESLTRTLLSGDSGAVVLRQIVKAAALVVPAADLVSITLRSDDGGFFTPVQTDECATELDEVQYRSGRGPCLDAARVQGPSYALSEDLGAESRWPEFAAAASEHGYRSILAAELVPALDSGRQSGALNVYSRRVDGFTEEDRHAVLILATHASLALARAHSIELAELNRIQLLQAIDSRDVIGQAKGILMNRQGISADAAFTILRETSQHLNVKLVDLAREFASRHTELDPR